MTTKINGRFSIERDSNCWLLVEDRPGVSKTGEPITTRDVTYYSQIEPLCLSVLNKSAGVACQESKNIVAAIQTARREILDALSMDKL
jgi:hypothetical protein